MSDDYIIVDGMPGLREAAEEDPNFTVDKDGKVTLAEGVEEATLDAGYLYGPEGHDDDTETVTGEVVDSIEFTHMMGIVRYEEFSLPEPGKYKVVKVDE